MTCPCYDRTAWRLQIFAYVKQTPASFESDIQELENARTISGGEALAVGEFRPLSPTIQRLLKPAPRRWRSLLGWGVIAACGGWIIGFFTARIAGQTCPWIVTLGLCSVFTLIWLYRKSAGPSLYAFRIAESRPLVISEGLSISFLAFSFAILGFISLYCVTPHTTKVTRQVVDIELIANNDAVDRHDILPGTVKKEEQNKKISSNVTQNQHGRTLAQTITEPKNSATPPEPNNSSAQTPSQKTAKTKANKTSPTAEKTPQALERQSKAPAQDTKPTPSERNQTTKAQQPNMFTQPPATAQQPAVVRQQLQPMRNMPSSWQTQTIATVQRSTPSVSKPSHAAPALEEVAPPEMVEITDSAGDSNANQLYQAGGHSAGGTGAKSSLAAYLKELHRRIKRSWTPPPGETRTAEILFRIQRNGKVVSMKLARSSGDSESDDAAMVAIGGCAPFKTLPADFPSDYLDLLYTFNYTADHLAEVPHQSVE